MIHKFTTGSHYELVQNWLLAVGGGSWVGWAILKEISIACAIILPITGVVSFLLFLVINYKKILQGFSDIFKSFR